MRDLLARKAAQASPLDVQLAALRTVHDQIPPEQRASFLARLDEVCRAWLGHITAEAAAEIAARDLPPGHPLPWDQLKPYERQQGGYWLMGTDPHGADKRWVRVKRPAEETAHA